MAPDFVKSDSKSLVREFLRLLHPPPSQIFQLHLNRRKYSKYSASLSPINVNWDVGCETIQVIE